MVHSGKCLCSFLSKVFNMLFVFTGFVFINDAQRLQTIEDHERVHLRVGVVNQGVDETCKRYMDSATYLVLKNLPFDQVIGRKYLAF